VKELMRLEDEVEDEEDVEDVGSDWALLEELLALLALLFLSFLSVEELDEAEELEDEVPESLLRPTGLSRSKPNCSKDLLKDVALVGSERCN
jgi:hypothetical protein